MSGPLNLPPDVVKRLLSLYLSCFAIFPLTNPEDRIILPPLITREEVASNGDKEAWKPDKHRVGRHTTLIYVCPQQRHGLS